METILGLILQMLVLICQILICVLSLHLRGARVEPPKQDAPVEEQSNEPTEEERRMQEYMKKMQEGMNNILNYDGTAQEGKQ